MEMHGQAIMDAEGSSALDKTYVKAYYRRGSAPFAQGKLKQAKKDFKICCKLKPKDRDARAKLAACDKAVKEAAFAEAIVSAETLPLSETLAVGEIHIDTSTYTGPHPSGGVVSNDEEEEIMMFEPGNLPIEFVMSAVEAFKSQKVRKLLYSVGVLCIPCQSNSTQLHFTPLHSTPLHPHSPPQLIHKRYVARVLISCKKLFESYPSLVELSLPAEGPDGKPESSRITVCGDTHGQFYDVMNIFETNGFPSKSNPYLFNGDFVDRGSFGLEVVLTYFLFKLSCVESISLSRGNHETKNMNKIYGFEGEVSLLEDENTSQRAKRASYN